MPTVLVFSPAGEPLNPCHPARARELLRKSRARIASLSPYAIRLVDASQPDGTGSTLAAAATLADGEVASDA